MLSRQLALQAGVLGLVLAACAVRASLPPPAACRVVSAAAPERLQPCLDGLADGATLALPPGRYVLRGPVTLNRAVTLTTLGRPDCAAAACAVLALRPAAPLTHPPLTLAAEGAALDHLVIEGARTEPSADTAACLGPGRPGMGLVAITARRVTIADSVLRDAVCYSAAVADESASGLRFTGNQVLANGTHRDQLWADGLTVLDGTDDVIRGNLFRDNTDVQLVLGGCLRCTVAANRIEAVAAASFAGLLIHGWPHTGGDYAGSVLRGNEVDCGPARACGFGIALGGAAWYAAATSGGTVAENRVRRAAVGIEVDGVTGPVTMRGNVVAESGGRVRSRCGAAVVGGVNIAPGSRRFVDATAGVAVPAEAVTGVSFTGCLPVPA